MMILSDDDIPVNDEGCIACVKIPTMIIMFLMIIVFGSIPLRHKAFKESKFILSMAGAFSGGLFLAVGVIHLLPEANDGFEEYFEQIGADPKKEQFPWAFFITVMSFALILFIEKIATADSAHNHAHQHQHSQIKKPSEVLQSNASSGYDQNISLQQQNDQNTLEKQMVDEDADFEQQVKLVSSQVRIAKRASFHQQMTNSFLDDQKNKVLQEIGVTGSQWAPYILQIAIGIFILIFQKYSLGIHAIFEGLAIGLQKEWLSCLSISLAVVCHKWAEGLTLGIAFRKANVDLKMSTIMIVIQAIMNPVGVGLGWILSEQGPLIMGIFTSISVGTFVYIATVEVIVEEFNLERYRWLKFTVFLIAIGFICSLYFLEQATGG